MFMSIMIMILALMLIVIMLGCYGKLDEIEKHDRAVRMRWAAKEESEPPEWADPDKWWQSERGDVPIFHVSYDSEQCGREK